MNAYELIFKKTTEDGEFVERTVVVADDLDDILGFAIRKSKSACKNWQFIKIELIAGAEITGTVEQIVLSMGQFDEN